MNDGNFVGDLWYIYRVNPVFRLKWDQITNHIRQQPHPIEVSMFQPPIQVQNPLAVNGMGRVEDCNVALQNAGNSDNVDDGNNSDHNKSVDVNVNKTPDIAKKKITKKKITKEKITKEKIEKKKLFSLGYLEDEVEAPKLFKPKVAPPPLIGPNGERLTRDMDGYGFGGPVFREKKRSKRRRG